MEKKIRHAGASRKTSRKNSGKVPALPDKHGRNRKALYALPQGPRTNEQIAETLGLVIPCRVDKPDRIHPIRLEIPCPCGKGGCITIRFQCEQCTAIYSTFRAWKRHTGMVPNVKGSCTGE